ncbi:MAG: hypothetical protein ACLR71_15690 [[Clostridium] scindens]
MRTFQQILDLSQIPWRASDRDESDPIVIGGGPCTYNPEPLGLTLPACPEYGRRGDGL